MPQFVCLHSGRQHDRHAQLFLDWPLARIVCEMRRNNTTPNRENICLPLASQTRTEPHTIYIYLRCAGWARKCGNCGRVEIEQRSHFWFLAAEAVLAEMRWNVFYSCVHWLRSIHRACFCACVRLCVACRSKPNARRTEEKHTPAHCSPVDLSPKHDIIERIVFLLVCVCFDHPRTESENKLEITTQRQLVR